MSDYARDAGAERRRDAGTLFVVATPIGNLEDITLRALRVLREVDVVAAEDTRRSGPLLRYYNIATSLVSLHEHNERLRGEQLVARLLRGESVALVSDAGTPGISDPGAVFVRAARAAGVRVEPVPGASAVTAVLSASGVVFDRYAYAGFPPIRVNDRKSWLNWVSALPDIPVVGFEAPHRIDRTLAEIRRYFVNRPILVARELTKLHEEWVFLPATSVPVAPTSVPVAVSSVSTSVPTVSTGLGVNAMPAKGEFAFIICPEVSHSGGKKDITDVEVGLAFGQLTENTVFQSRKDAVKAVAARLGVSTKSVYDALERIKKAPQT
jgi:16S rRNA (cytidine1402-2'-O)-methyltransferase